MHKKQARTAIAGCILFCTLLLTIITSSQTFAATRNAAETIHLASNGRTCPMTVQEGSEGAPVTTLQVELSWVFGYNVPVDGKFGPETDTAVRDFQSRTNLPVNGVVGPQTWHALGEC